MDDHLNRVMPPPTLRGKDFRLVPLSREHLGILHEWESDTSSLYLWTTRKDILSEGEFNEALASRLRGYYHVFLMVLDSENKPVGFIYSYDANFVDGFVFVTTFLEPSSRNRGLGAKVGLLFYDYLFAYYPVRKVYCDVFEYNDESLLALKHAGFEIEGTFKEHRFFRGRYYTLYRLALYREKFYEKFDSMIRKVASEDSPS